jgi:hypothetical protein
VFFKGSKDGDFSVDKEAQAKVTDELDAFIASNGGLVMCVYPSVPLHIISCLPPYLRMTDFRLVCCLHPALFGTASLKGS